MAGISEGRSPTEEDLERRATAVLFDSLSKYLGHEGKHRALLPTALFEGRKRLRDRARAGLVHEAAVDVPNIRGVPV